MTWGRASKQWHREESQTMTKGGKARPSQGRESQNNDKWGESQTVTWEDARQ